MVMKLNAGAAVVLSVCLTLAFFAGHSAAAGGGGDKKVDVEGIVRKEVAKAIKRKPVIGAALVRLLFHDCWVKGCDGSVLLEKTRLSSKDGTEKAAANNIGLDGFDVIEAIKEKLGHGVSCADIVVLDARDATGILSRGKIVYAVKKGRKDGVVSSAVAADAFLPPPTFNFTQLKNNFAAKNFDQRELVALSGVHAVGIAHLSSFQDRLDNSTTTPINARYQKALADDVEVQKSLQRTQDPTEKNNIRDMDLAFRNASGYDAAGVDTAATGVTSTKINIGGA